VRQTGPDSKVCLQCGGTFTRRTVRFGSNFNRMKFCGRACVSARNKFDAARLVREFWAKVNKSAPNGCWLWTGAVNTTGYGMVSGAGMKNIVAHRFAWKLLKGEIPAGLRALHHCDTPRCCNPEHIFLGTQKDNTADAMAKGRTTKGRTLPHLNAQAVLEIRRRRQEGERYSVLSAHYGVSIDSVYRAASGKTYGHLK
jgi:hypothetical protein